MSVSMIKRPQPAGRYQHSQFAHTHRVFGRNEQAGPANRRTRRSPAWRDAIRTRAARRRIPWAAAGGVAVTATLAWGVVALFDTVDVPSTITSGVMAAFPVVYAGIGAAQARPRVGGWAPDLTLSTLAACGLVFWVGLAGPSWLAALALLAGTLLGGARWWLAHPVGPRTPSLEPDAEPEPEPAPTEVSTYSPPEVVDSYVVDWDLYNAPQNGKAPRSRLTNRGDEEHAVTYDVELNRGQQTYRDLLANADKLAGGLDINAENLLFEEHPESESRARMTIITGDPVSETRFWTGPRVTATKRDGIVHNTARYLDGRGELDIIMWNTDGMVPTAIIGKSGGGKSGAGNVCTAGALHTGLMNLLYIDPKGNSSSALRSTARIAIIGPAEAARAPELAGAILEARRAYTVEHGIDKLKPSTSMPGWQFLHDEFSELVNRKYLDAAKAWCSIVNTVRSLGIWPVAMSQAMQESKWGDDQTRSAFAAQAIVFRMKTMSDDLLPGLEYRPHQLPAKAGMAVYSFEDAERSNVPTRWDWLPSDSDIEELDEAPPYSTSEALATFDQQPELHPVDAAAIESVLGPPVGGRWVVGPGGTHEFPNKGSSKAKGASKPASRPKPTGFGITTAPSDEEQSATTSEQNDLSPVQASVLAVVDGGTEQVSEIVEAANASRSSVNDALTKLAALGLIEHYGRGRYRRV